MSKSTVVPFELPSEFSPDPLTEVIQFGARELLRTAVQAEVAGFMAVHAHLLDEEGRQRLVRHGFLPEREVMTGIGTVPVQVVAEDAPSVRAADGDGPRPGCERRWQQDQGPFILGAAVSIARQSRLATMRGYARRSASKSRCCFT